MSRHHIRTPDDVPPGRNRDDAPPLNPWTRFWFTPEGPFGLHVVRVITGALLIFWLLTLAPDAPGLFSLNGWFDRAAYLEASRQPNEVPKPFAWSFFYLCGENVSAFWAMYWGAVVTLLLFTLGVFPRLTAVLTWLITLSLTASPAFDDEVEVLFRLLTMYLAVGYVLAGPWTGTSWTEALLGSWRTFLFARRIGDAPKSIGVNVALRLIQVHLAIVLVTSGLHKLQSSAWWSGVAHWYLLLPPLEVTAGKVQQMATSGRTWMALMNLAAYATLVWQLTFPAFAWRTGWWRAVLIGGAVVGWIGLATLYRMPLFGPALLTGCLAYLSAAEWQVVREWLGRVWARISAVRAGSEERPLRRSTVVVGGR